MQSTLKSDDYLLKDIDIMDVCRNYCNSDISFRGDLGFKKIKKVKNSVNLTVDGNRSFDQKRLSADASLDLLVFEMGELMFFAEDETVYMLAPLLGDDIGYAFPTGINLFMKAPDLTHDIDYEWFSSNLKNIYNLTKEMGIVATGNTIVDSDGTISDEFIITIPRGTGGFIWELLGMESPDYDVVCTMYLTKKNHIRRIECDLKDVLPGGYVVIDGENVGECIFTYELPENELFKVSAFRNSKVEHWMDVDAIYYANNGQELSANMYITWEQDDSGFALKVNDINIYKDGVLQTEGYFVGNVVKEDFASDVFGGREAQLYSLEELQWRKVRDNAEEFIGDILEKTSFSAFSM